MNGFIQVGANRWIRNPELVICATPSGTIHLGGQTIDPNEYFGIPKYLTPLPRNDDDDDDERPRRRARKRSVTLIGATPVGTLEVVKFRRGWSVYQVDPNTWKSERVHGPFESLDDALWSV